MSKSALCFKTEEVSHGFQYLCKDTRHVPTHAGKLIVLNSEPFLVPREICENDSSYLQLIPYVTLVSIKTNELLTFTRGKGGVETRLLDKRSIGLGGHIDCLPDENRSIFQLIGDEVARELKEEVDLKLSCDISKIVQTKLRMNNFRLLHNTSTEVDSYHLGLFIYLTVPHESITEAEPHKVSNLHWRSVSDLTNPPEKDFKLEEWSKLVLGTKAN